jgi:hypothetical protein
MTEKMLNGPTLKGEGPVVPPAQPSPDAGAGPALLTITNCMDCPHHVVVMDPDPSDWFNYDDEAVLCRLTQGNGTSPARCSAVTWEFQAITVSCRPYQKRKECAVPNWCPLRAGAAGRLRPDGSIGGVERADTGAVEQPRGLSPHEVSPSVGE